MRNLRTLLILITRQFSEDGPYFAGALSMVVLLPLVLAVIGYFYPYALLPAVMFILIGLPLVAGMALCS